MSAAQVAGQWRSSLDTVRQWPDVPPTIETLGRHLDTVSQSYWPGLLHCYAVPDLPRTNNALESHCRETRRRLLRITGPKGLTQRTLHRQGAWALLPRPSTEAQGLETVGHTPPAELAQERQRFAQHRQRFSACRADPCDRLKRKAINGVSNGRPYSLRAQGALRGIASKDPLQGIGSARDLDLVALPPPRNILAN